MKISIIGTGYVGLVTGACLAELGNDVLCLDTDAAKIGQLRQGVIPIFEPGLEDLVQRNAAVGRLRFTADPAASARHGTVQFIAVGTPAGEGGAADMDYVMAAARDIGRHMEGYRVVVDKSTVPVGTAEAVAQAIRAELKGRGVEAEFSVVSNPEFLKEGAAVEDFMRPDRIVVGADDERAIEIMRTLYTPIQRNHERMIVMDVKSAELTKYAANAMLATRISFMNELANLAEVVGADIEHVRQGIGSDRRIGYGFLYAGCGYGGSCFPKDIAALRRTAEQHGVALQILEAVAAINRTQKRRLLDKMEKRLGQDWSDLRFALWGLAFKPNTDDLREATSLEVIEGMLSRGAHVVAYDPIAMPRARQLFSGKPRMGFAANPLAAMEDADALVIVTEWKEFRSPDFEALRQRLKRPLVFDGRNLYDPGVMERAGLEYHGIGRSNVREPRK